MKNTQKIFRPLEQITRSHITTDEAAYYLNRKAQTQRVWACYQKGPIQPLSLNDRLAWRVADIKRLLGEEE